MKFETTADNEPYLRARGKIVLNACPGSGKTTAVAFKLTELTKECQQEFGNYAGIACLSFTNVAKDEIIDKYEKLKGDKLAYPHLVSTIDSFINRFITLPFYYLLGYDQQRPLILTSVAFLDEIRLGWFANKKGQALKFSYPPSKLKMEIDGSVSWDGNSPNPDIVDPNVFQNFANAFKTWQLQNGYLDNDDSSYIAMLLLQRFPHIGEALAKRFPYIVIDEAQDTCEIQYRIFDSLVNSGLSNIEFVGDPYQSLYEFRKARPDLFLQRFSDSANWTALRLDACRRSSQYIINSYSAFRSPKEVAIVSICSHTTNHRLKVIRYNIKKIEDLVNKYVLLVDAKQPTIVLVRGAKHLELLGVKPTSENPWKNDFAKTLTGAQYHYERGNIKASIDDLRMFLAEISIPRAGPVERKDKEKSLREDVGVNMVLFNFLKGMPSIDDSLVNWTTNMTNHIKTEFGIDVDLQLKQKGNAFQKQIVKDVLYPKNDILHPVSTIHKVKGKTFHSVLLLLSENSSGQNISLSDFVKPGAIPTEKQRMIYVALSRPEVLACVAVPDRFTEAEIVDKLGNEIEFV